MGFGGASRHLDNITTRGSIGVEELKEESNFIIFIVGLILLIVWKITMICQVRLHRKHNRLEKLVEQSASVTTGREATFIDGR